MGFGGVTPAPGPGSWRLEWQSSARLQASLTVPRSPSSSRAVIESHGICIFWNHVANARSSGACMMHTIFPFDRLRKLRYGSNRRVVLGGLCDLADLFARQGASRHGMAAHEFRHRICTFLLCYFGAAVLCRLGLGNYLLLRKPSVRSSPPTPISVS